jgi:hypothetical protein
MAIILGSVSVAPDGAVTKSGECGTLYDLLAADATQAAADVGSVLPSGAALVSIRKSLARLATTIATYNYGLLTARASVKVATTDTGLQTTPNPNNAATATTGPAVDKFLSIV